MALTTESTVLKENATVMALIAEAEPGQSWLATVFIARPAGQPPIRAGDVDAQLIDEHGPLPVISRPSDTWVEAGGAAGTTASSAFTFAAGAGVPRLLRISWAGEGADLKVLPAP
jgi:hypothetical protein